MKLSRSKLAVIATGCIWTAGPAHAQTTLDPATLNIYGGIYSPDCRNPTTPRLRVLPDALLMEKNGAPPITGHNPHADRALLGPNPPPGYQVALVSEVGKAPQIVHLVFVVYRDQGGTYISLDGDGNVRPAMGAMLTWKFRRCDSSGKTGLGISAPASPPKPVASLVPKPPKTPIKSNYFLMQDKPFLALLRKALGPKVKEGWLVDGPETAGKTVEVEGTEYLVATVCQPQDCGDNTLVLLYSAAQKQVYGKLVRPNASRLLGAPPPAVAAALDGVWASEWGQNR
jgi:hypothetical protein